MPCDNANFNAIFQSVRDYYTRHPFPKPNLQSCMHPMAVYSTGRPRSSSQGVRSAYTMLPSRYNNPSLARRNSLHRVSAVQSCTMILPRATSLLFLSVASFIITSHVAPPTKVGSIISITFPFTLLAALSTHA